MERYTKDDKMCEILTSNERLLQIVSKFAIPLGVNEKTIVQVCEENNIDTDTFLAIVNFELIGKESINLNNHLDLKTLCLFLQNTHTYLIKFLLPHIRRHLIDALGYSNNNDITFLIIKFFDDYCKELEQHMQMEEQEIFPYIDMLLEGKTNKKLSNYIDNMHTNPVEAKLTELKTIIIKYYSSNKGNDMIYNILQHLFMCEYDLYFHDKIETSLLKKELQYWESKVRANEIEEDVIVGNEMLTQREKDIVIGIAKGWANKEIGDKLCISVHTVTTHRKNIAKKLNIHTTSGLTIYAIVNNLIDIKDIKS